MFFDHEGTCYEWCTAVFCKNGTATGAGCSCLSLDMVLEEKLVYCLKYLPSIMENVPVVFVKLGCDGVLVAEQNAASGKGYNATHYAPAPERFLPVSVVSVTGAGDRCSAVDNSQSLAVGDTYFKG